MYFWKVYFPKAYQLSESVFSKGGIFIFLFNIFSEIVFSENLFSESFFFKRVFFTKLICISPIPKMHFSDLVRWRGVHYNALGPWVNICSFELLATCFMLIWCKNIYVCTLHSHTTHTTLITCWPHHRYKLLDHQRSCRTGNTAQKWNVNDDRTAIQISNTHKTWVT